MTHRALKLRRENGRFWNLNPEPTEWNNHDQSAGVYLGPSPELLGPPRIRFNEQAINANSGVKTTFLDHQYREIGLEFVVIAAQPDQLEATTRDFLEFLDPVYNTGPIELVYTTAQGRERVLDVNLIGGHEGSSIAYDESAEARFTVLLRADNPYWRDDEYTRFRVPFVATGGSDLITAAGYTGTIPTPMDAANWTHGYTWDIYTFLAEARYTVPLKLAITADNTTDLGLFHIESGEWLSTSFFAGQDYYFIPGPWDRQLLVDGAGDGLGDFVDPRSKSMTRLNTIDGACTLIVYTNSASSLVDIDLKPQYLTP